MDYEWKCTMNDFTLSASDFLAAPLVVTSTLRGGEPVTLLTISPGKPPARMTLDEWREWVAADHDRMLKELETWADAFVLAVHERTKVPAAQ